MRTTSQTCTSLQGLALIFGLLLMAGSARAQSYFVERDFNSGDVVVKTHGFAEAFCASGQICTQSLQYFLPPDLDVAEVFLTGWYVKSTNGQDRYKKLRVGVTNVFYDPPSGYMEVEAFVRSDTESLAQVEYGLTWAVVAGESSSLEFAQKDSFCTSSNTQTNPFCGDTDLVVAGVHNEFHGFGMREIDLTLGAYSNLVRLRADTTKSTSKNELNTYCGWEGGTATGAATTMTCRVRTTRVLSDALMVGLEQLEFSSQYYPTGSVGSGFEVGRWQYDYYGRPGLPIDGLFTTLQKVDFGYADPYGAPPDYYTPWPGGSPDFISVGCDQAEYPTPPCAPSACSPNDAHVAFHVETGGYGGIQHHPAVTCSVGWLLQ